MFKVGDRVECTLRWHVEGGKGTILIIDGPWYGVRFDKTGAGLHDLDGLCEPGFGLWLRESQIKILNEMEPVTGDPRIEGNL